MHPLFRIDALFSLEGTELRLLHTSLAWKLVETRGIEPLQMVTTAGHSPAYRVLITVNLRSARCGQGIGDDTQLYYAKLGRDTKLSSSTNLLIRGITLAMTPASFLCR